VTNSTDRLDRTSPSARVTTDWNGAVVAEQGHYPYGETWYDSGSAHKWKFTSYQRDAESGNDYAIFRYHGSRLGRFSSADPLRGRTRNPQRLNRYAYVLNDPVHNRDPQGLDLLEDVAFDVGGGGGEWFEGGGGGGVDPIGIQPDPSLGGWGVDPIGVGLGCDPTIDPTCGGCDPILGCDSLFSSLTLASLTPRQKCMLGCAVGCTAIFVCVLLPPPLDVFCVEQIGANCVECTLLCAVRYPN